MAIRRYPPLIIANTPMGDILRIARSHPSQTVAKSATNGHHASGTLSGSIVISFLRTVQGKQILEPPQQPANNLYLAQDYLVSIATEKFVSIKSFKVKLLEKSFDQIKIVIDK